MIGQNESGKTSVLEALWKTFSAENLSEEETRFNSPLPVTYLQVTVSQEEIESELPRALSETEKAVLAQYLETQENCVGLQFEWKDTGAKADARYEGSCLVSDGDLEQQLGVAHETDLGETAAASVEEKPAAPKLPVTKPISSKDLEQAMMLIGPNIEFFKQDIGLLPNTIDIGPENKLAENGSAAARNFLAVADIDLPKLLAADARTRKSYLDHANQRITKEFNKFWTQIIGKARPLRLECELEYYGPNTPTKLGQPYLVFWISNDLTRLYPRQRSAGVRWFVSFFLQLKATERAGVSRIFLLDEPGANLHSRAQEDVLRLIGELSKTIPIVYSTHSQDMVDFDKPYRGSRRATRRRSGRQPYEDL